MRYPYFLQSSHQQIFPIFGNQLKGDPVYLDVSDSSEKMNAVTIYTHQDFVKFIESYFVNGKNWGVSGYLEYRQKLLCGYESMRKYERYYHLGVDVTGPVGTSIFAPLDGEVYFVGDENDEAGYGGYVVLQHTGDFDTFYSLYGHLYPENLPKVGEKITTGTQIGKLADYNNNGGWYPHLHLQVLTQNGVNNGYIPRGYANRDELIGMEELCPNPMFLMKW